MFRYLHRAWASLFGYFWLPCSHCGEPFGGHQWRNRGGHFSDIPREWTGMGGKAICPACTRRGVGCRAWRGRLAHLDCDQIRAGVP